MVALDWSMTRLPPYAHQRVDTAALLEHPFYFIASKPRTGKTKIVIDAAQFMFQRNVIDRVLIVAPAPVAQGTWFDRTLGQLNKHLWHSIHSLVLEYHSAMRDWEHGPLGDRTLTWCVTNFEFIRPTETKLQGVDDRRLQGLLPFCTPRTLLVIDESSYVRSWRSAQTKACFKLRKKCGRVVEMNGTPVFKDPMDLFTQANLLDESVLECKFVSQFRARWAKTSPVLGPGGRAIKDRRGRVVEEITGWKDLDGLQAKLAPYIVMRTRDDCPDMPKVLPSVTLTFPLSATTWRHYKAMRDDLVVWFKNNRAANSKSAAIKVMRLSQITSGFVGGVKHSELDIDGLLFDDEMADFKELEPGVAELGREKLDGLLWFVGEQLKVDPNVKVLSWSRFRPEVQRATREVKQRFGHLEVAQVWGGQKEDERLAALRLLDPDTTCEGPAYVAGVEGTGSFGLDMTASHVVVTLSRGYTAGLAEQTLDRVIGPRQKHAVAYYDVVATGPQGQRTIDHDIVRSRQEGENLARRTSEGWIRVLTEE